MRKLTILMTVILVFGLLFTGCWLFPATRYITADPESVTLTLPDESIQQLVITYYDEYGAMDVTTKCTYQSSNTDVATVGSLGTGGGTKGLIKAVAPGSTTIRVTYWHGKYELTCDIPVEVTPIIE